ncbi:MAG: long-chain fatty acid--CoA ligase [Phenylobacterium sp.]|nr:long-chain fatty acid--CoA ligase [Phenylobacterium sp.]
MGGRIIAGDRCVSHDEVRVRAARAAAGLSAMGVGEGDAIALLMRNDVAFFEAMIAAALLGAYAVPINWRFTAQEAAYILSDSGAKALIGEPDLLAPLPPALTRDLAVFATSGPQPASADSWEGLIGAHAPLQGPKAAPRSPMIYTSGTTGRPKGVRRGPPTGATASAAAGLGFDMPDPIVVLMTGPLHHSAPLFYALTAFARGADIILQRGFDPEELLRQVEAHEVTHMHMVPTMFVRLLRLPPAVRTRHQLSSLRHVLHGAAPCAVAVKEAMIAWWGPIIHEYYGSTETGVAVGCDSEDARRKPGTVGRALPGCTVKVLGPDGEALAAGEVGEVFVRCHDLPDFTYHNRDAERAEAGYGELVSVGDLGYLDADGYLFLCDRKRDVVISGGVNIYPAEIEAVLITLPGVRDCAVFGIPDEEFGEALCAVIEPDGAESIDAAGVTAFLRSGLAAFKVPKRIEFATQLPREDTGKVFKRKLREPYWAGRSI